MQRLIFHQRQAQMPAGVCLLSSPVFVSVLSALGGLCVQKCPIQIKMTYLQHLEVFDQPMLTSWLCCRASPLLCSCSEWSPELPHTFCQRGAHQKRSRRPLPGPGCLHENQRFIMRSLTHNVKTNHLLT